MRKIDNLETRGPSKLGAVFAVILCGFGCGDGGCSGAPPNRATETAVDQNDDSFGQPAVANPASAHCVELGHRLELRQGPDGEFGVCVFADGSACEEWSFFKGSCAPGTCRNKDGLCE